MAAAIVSLAVVLAAAYRLGGLDPFSLRTGVGEAGPASAAGPVWTWTVHVNGLAVARAQPPVGGDARRPRIPVADLVRMVDGPGVLRSSRLRVDGTRLYAAALGGCGGCPVRVRRAVLVSASVDTLHLEATIPLEDLIRALEGRLEVLSDLHIYAVFAGACGWCVLEPRGLEAGADAPSEHSLPAEDAGVP